MYPAGFLNRWGSLDIKEYQVLVLLSVGFLAFPKLHKRLRNRSQELILILLFLYPLCCECALIGKLRCCIYEYIVLSEYQRILLLFIECHASIVIFTHLKMFCLERKATFLSFVLEELQVLFYLYINISPNIECCTNSCTCLFSFIIYVTLVKFLLLQDKVLKFYAKTFSSSPLNMTRELYTSLGMFFMI